MSVGALSSDWTIIKKNILRSWPIWVTYLVVLAIIGPVSIWLTYSGNTLYHMYDTICKDMVNQSAFISIIAASVCTVPHRKHNILGRIRIMIPEIQPFINISNLDTGSE